MSILNVFMVVIVCVCAYVFLNVCMWPWGSRPSALLVGMHPCNCRGQSMVTLKLPGGQRSSTLRGISGDTLDLQA